MFDITYCNIESCKNWTCEKADSCKRNLQREEIPVGEPFSMANLFSICKDKDYHMYIPYSTEVETC